MAALGKGRAEMRRKGPPRPFPARRTSNPGDRCPQPGEGRGDRPFPARREPCPAGRPWGTGPDPPSGRTGRIDENGHDEQVVFRTRAADQGGVPSWSAPIVGQSRSSCRPGGRGGPGRGGQREKRWFPRIANCKLKIENFKFSILNFPRFHLYHSAKRSSASTLIGRRPRGRLPPLTHAPVWGSNSQWWPGRRCSPPRSAGGGSSFSCAGSGRRRRRRFRSGGR